MIPRLIFDLSNPGLLADDRSLVATALLFLRYGRLAASADRRSKIVARLDALGRLRGPIVAAGDKHVFASQDARTCRA